MADASRYVGNGEGNREIRSRRGVCETSNTMDDAKCSKRRPVSTCGTGSQQGNDGNRGETDCRIGIANTALGNSHQQRTYRSGSSNFQTRRRELAQPSGFVADSGDTRPQGGEQQPAHEQDGRTDGRSRNHADQLPNFVAHFFLPQDQTMRDGQESSNKPPSAPLRLNPIFVEWLMGWRMQWTSPEPHACGAEETALFRSALRSQLSNLFGDPAS